MPKNLDSLSTNKPADASVASKEVATPQAPSSAGSAKTDAPSADTKAEVKADTASAKPPVTTPASTASAVSSPMPEPGKDGESFETMFPEPSVTISGPPGWIWWILLIAASIGLGLVGYKLLNSRVDSWLSLSPSPSPSAAASKATPTPTPKASSATPTPTPAVSTPTPSPVIKSSVTMRVQNGTTVSGAATTVKGVLEKAGFTVRSVGNAAVQNHTTTVIYYQTGRIEEAKVVQTALTQYSPTIEESTDQATPDMIVVIYGTK